MASCCRPGSGKLAWPGVPLQGPGLSNATSYTPVEFRPVENPLDPMSLRVTKKRCRLSPFVRLRCGRCSSFPAWCGARALRRIFWRRSQASLLAYPCRGAFLSYKLVPITKRSFLYFFFSDFLPCIFCLRAFFSWLFFSVRGFSSFRTICCLFHRLLCFFFFLRRFSCFV